MRSAAKWMKGFSIFRRTPDKSGLLLGVVGKVNVHCYSFGGFCS